MIDEKDPHVIEICHLLATEMNRTIKLRTANAELVRVIKTYSIPLLIHFHGHMEAATWQKAQREIEAAIKQNEQLTGENK